MKTTFWYPTLEECTIISNGISEENKKSPHMMPVTAESLYEFSKIQAAYVLYVENTLAGFIKIMPLGDGVYEWWSLFVLESHRGIWLSNQLIQHILTKHHDKALLCVTNVPQVQKVCATLEQAEIKRGDMHQWILEIIEAWQALLKNDHVFWNQRFMDVAKK